MIGYPYTYGDDNNVSYELKLRNKTVNSLKGVIHKTYEITQIIFKSGLVQKLTIGFVTFVYALGL